MTGERERFLPEFKRTRLLEIMDYLSDPTGVAEAIHNIPPDLEDFQDLGITHMDIAE